MAKKNINDKNPTKINDNKFGKGELTIVDGNEASFLKESVLCSGVQKQHHISRLNIIELVALEKACSLLCKRYEIIARIDDNNNEKLMILSHQEDPDTSLDAAEIELIN